MCPEMLARCAICTIRGHPDQAHKFGLNKSPLEVRQLFKKFCQFGKYTSLPFLYLTGKIRNAHWKALLSSTSMARGQGDLWMYTGLKEGVDFDTLETKARHREVAGHNLRAKEEDYESLNFEDNPPPSKRRR